jgi:hypothetical protein
MIGTSLHEYLFIRLCILLLRFLPALEAVCLLILWVRYGNDVSSSTITWLLASLLSVETVFALGIYVPYQRRLKLEAKHPPPLSTPDRKALFQRCISNIPDQERYIRVWFLGAEMSDIRRDNIREFLLWAFFDSDGDGAAVDEAIADEMEGYVQEIEKRLCKSFEPGRGKAKCLRLTIDAIETRYRSVLWYVVVGFVDFFTHCQLAWNGFQYHAQSLDKVFGVAPVRVQQVFSWHRSPTDRLSYWYRPHTATDKLPIVFFHGIGIGLLTYNAFLAEINENHGDGDGQIGIIAVEILPVSFRLTAHPLDKAAFLEQMSTILEYHGWTNFVLTSHSYGSVLTTHMIHSPEMQARIPALVLMDPVSVLLHLPDVAYNFTRRKPRRANEWQLWYFASMDPGVAHCLGRHFFWRENAVWKDELVTIGTSEQAGAVADHPPRRKRKVTVCLSGRDLIVDTATVAQYLAGAEPFTDDGWISGSFSDSVTLDSGSSQTVTDEPEREGRQGDHLAAGAINIIWFPTLDHAQIFDHKKDRDRVLPVLRSYCES